ncbi:calcium-activated chloride channel regulator 1-like [Lineus longissimus]|uniref:calcium-activated chloride channel regulator 1-like n=1 Tax=Lineus longissimus TaxID=88925 RepID=UPI002B4D1585
MAAPFLLLSVVAVLFGPSSQLPNEVKLEKNAYKEVLVAIGSDVKENDDVIKRIQDVFTKASVRLHTATRQRVYFNSVNILIPDTWQPKPEYQIPQSGQTFDSSNVRIDTPNPVWGNNPYTKQLGGCGEAGEFIHLTPEYLLKKNASEYRWGPPDKSLVHEWGHLRWGLFDEYPIDKEGDSHFYQTGTRLNPVRCTEDVRGRPLNSKTFDRCKVDRATLQVEKDCRFYPDLKENSVKASQMYMQFIDSVQDFCDDGTLGDSLIIHNRLAPNKQNRMCGGQSAWEVMRKHMDFKDGANPATVSVPATSFQLLQRKSKRVVLLLDTSTSMLTPDEIPITLMIQAARYYILDLLEAGTQLSVITFDKAAVVKMPLIKITDMASRQAMLEFLPRKNETADATALGAGLLQSVGVLTDGGSNNDGAKGSKIIVISDGQQTAQPSAEEIMRDDVIPRNIVVDTVAYSSEADLYLSEMSATTGGKSFFISSDLASTGLFDAMNAIGTSDESDLRTAPVTVESSAMTVSPPNSTQGSFFIDSTIGNNTKMMYAYLIDTEVEVKVTSPSGVVFDKNSPNYSNDRTLKQIEIDVPATAEVGEWKYEITAQKETTVMAHVLSKAKGDKEDAIRVQSFFGKGAKTLGEEAAAQLTIFAQVTRGYAPVIGVNVIAIIEGDNTKIFVPLQDKGIGVDITKDDGIYSGMFTRHLINVGGRYNVKINVDNPENKGKIATSGGGSGALTIPRNITDPIPSEVKYEDVGSMKRVAVAGEMQVDPPINEAEVKDVIPPPRITDLKVTMVTLNDSILTLTWTAVGDDVSRGNETVYDLRVGSYEEILDKPDQSTSINMITLQPPEIAGEVETRQIDLSLFDHNHQTHFFRIRSTDEAGNSAEYSNIVSVVLALPETFSSGGAVVFAGDEVPVAGPGDNTAIIAIACIFGIIGFAVLVVAVFAIIYAVNKRKVGGDTVVTYDNAACKV